MELQDKMEHHIFNSVSKITKYFMNLHALLQCMELELINDVSNVSKNHTALYETLTTSIQTSISKIDSEIKLLKFYRHDMPTDIDIQNELKKSDTMLQNIPITVNIEKLQYSPIE